MADRDRLVVLTDAQWAALEPLIEACRPRGKTPHHDLRRTIEAIIWRPDNGAKWRSIPPELGPWWMAAQTFNRWGHLGVWERLLEAAQAGRVALGISNSNWPDRRTDIIVRVEPRHGAAVLSRSGSA